MEENNNIPPAVLLRTFWKHVYARGSMDTALESLHAIKDAKKRKLLDLSEILWTAFFVAYARPFTSNRQIGTISSKLVPPEHRDTHEICLAARNTLFGHSDPGIHAIEETGLLRVTVEITRKGFAPGYSAPMPAHDEWQRYHDLAEAVAHSLHHEIGRDLQRIPGLRALPDGLYLVDISGSSGARLARTDEDTGDEIIVTF